MATNTTSAPQQGINMPAVDLRQLFGSLVSAEGVRTIDDLKITQRAAGANMSVDVSTGAAAIRDDHASGGGFYAYTLATSSNVAIATAHATLPRIDRVVIRIRDVAYGDPADDQGPVVVAGTATSGATLVNTTGAAAVPGSSVLLANVLVPAATSSILTANIDTTGASNNSPPVRPMLGASSAYEYGSYAQITGTVPIGTATETAPVDVITLPSTGLDGSTSVFVEFSGIVLVSGAIGETAGVSLWEGSTDLGRLAVVQNNATSQMFVTLFGRLRLTPSNASHTYKIRGWQIGGTTGSSVIGGAGGVGGNPPAYARIVKI